jgi:hypothetical protein
MYCHSDIICGRRYGDSHMDLVTASETSAEILALGQSYRFLAACYLFQLYGGFRERLMTRSLLLLNTVFWSMIPAAKLIYKSKSCIFWDITPCSSLKVSSCFGVTCRFHLQGWRVRKARNQYEQSRWLSRADTALYLRRWNSHFNLTSEMLNI